MNGFNCAIRKLVISDIPREFPFELKNNQSATRATFSLK